jgi:hypothetical protein
MFTFLQNHTHQSNIHNKPGTDMTTELCLLGTADRFRTYILKDFGVTDLSNAEGMWIILR